MKLVKKSADFSYFNTKSGIIKAFIVFIGDICIEMATSSFEFSFKEQEILDQLINKLLKPVDYIYENNNTYLDNDVVLCVLEFNKNFEKLVKFIISKISLEINIIIINGNDELKDLIFDTLRNLPYEFNNLLKITLVMKQRKPNNIDINIDI